MSPHLDDAVLSLGATIRAESRGDVSIDVVTVLAGDISSTAPADPSNLKAGFTTAGEAARVRRAEDQRACELLGARAVWLDFADDANEARATRDDLLSELERRLAGYDSVLLPGCPLDHPDHRLISRLTLDALPSGQGVGLYVEQPYASWRALSREGGRSSWRAMSERGLEALELEVRPTTSWRSRRCAPANWVAKARASGEYRSQLAVLRRAPRTRIFGYELLHGGEAILWLTLR